MYQRSPALLRPLAKRTAQLHASSMTVLGLLLAASAACAQADASAALPRWQVEASLTHDDNVTRARSDAEIAADASVGLRLVRDWDFPLNPNMRLLLSASAGVEGFARFQRLSRAFGEVEAVVEYRAAGSFSAPTYGVFIRASGDESRSTLRSGSRIGIGARVAVPLTDRIFAVASIGHEEVHARSAVFAGRRNSARMNLDYALSDVGTLYAAVDLRQGDSTGSGGASLENVDIAKSFVADDAFEGKELLTYRFEARTVVAVIGYNHGLGPGASFDVSWRRAETRPREGLPFASSVPDRYVANQIVLAFLKRF